MKRRTLRACLGVCAVLCACWRPTAHASPLFETVGDVGATAAFTARSTPEGSGAAFFNPALLTDTQSGVTLAFMLLNQRIGVALDGRPTTAYAVPGGLENARSAVGDRFELYPIPTNILQYGREETTTKPALAAHPRQGDGSGHSTQSYFLAGFVLRMFDDRVSFGFHGLIPSGQFTRMRAFYNDEREQYFSNSLHPELYADRMMALSLALGMGVKLHDSLSVGIGTSFALKTSVMAGAYVVDTGNFTNLLLNMDAPVEMGLAPHFGVNFKPTDFLRFTATAHSPQQIELGAGFAFLLPNLIAEQSELNFVLDYMPWRIHVGGAWDILEESEHVLTLSAGAVYATWSDYVDRHGDTPSPNFTWSDTLAPTLGLTYQYDRFRASINSSYVPTPVPLQRGRTNYVDNDRLGSSFGAEYAFDVLDTKLKFGGQFQAHMLVERYNAKYLVDSSAVSGLDTEYVRDEVPDGAKVGTEEVLGAAGLQTNNPGWPGFASGGWLLNASLYVAMAF